MLMFYHWSDVGDMLCNSVNNHVHDIVTELQPPKSSRRINNIHKKLKWVHPPPRQFKVNVDGSYFTNNGSSSYGGLVRDQHCKFFGWFYGENYLVKYSFN